MNSLPKSNAVGFLPFDAAAAVGGASRFASSFVRTGRNLAVE
jgi:hypothetical protein